MNECTPGTVTLIRVNPDFPLSSNPTGKNRIISIKAKGLATIEKIDEFLHKPCPPELQYTPESNLYDISDINSMSSQHNEDNDSNENENDENTNYQSSPEEYVKYI